MRSAPFVVTKLDREPHRPREMRDTRRFNIVTNPGLGAEGGSPGLCKLEAVGYNPYASLVVQLAPDQDCDVVLSWIRPVSVLERLIPKMDQDPKAQLGYRLYWKRIALHLNLRDIASELGTRSVDLSGFEKGDFTKLTPEQLTAYLEKLDMSDKAADYLDLMQAETPIAESGQ